VQQMDADGIHLSSTHLYDYQQRPLTADKQVAASCHTLADLQQAMRIGVDFVVLSPVQVTASHPSLPRLGWQHFAHLTEQARLPVYALGGMKSAHLPIAWAHGAQGIAGISGLWPGIIKTD
jgi:8-oxo-dGTP diphosphatase